MLQRIDKIEKIVEAEAVRAEERFALTRCQRTFAVQSRRLGDNLAKLLAAIRLSRRAGEIKQLVMVLNARAIAALEGSVGEIENDVESLIRDIDASIQKAELDPA